MGLGFDLRLVFRSHLCRFFRLRFDLIDIFLDRRLQLLHWNLLSPKTLPALEILGKLAMADVFLIALYIVIVKGAGYVTIETAWGLYLFTGCILAQGLVSWNSKPTV